MSQVYPESLSGVGILTIFNVIYEHEYVPIYLYFLIVSAIFCSFQYKIILFPSQYFFHWFCNIFKNTHPRIYLLTFRERECKMEREREYRCEKHWLVVIHMCPKWDQTCNVGMCLERGLNPWSIGVGDDTPTTKQPSQGFILS